MGLNSPLSDAEIIVIAAKSLEKLGFKNYKIRVGDRKLFKGIPPAAITIIDKLKKIGSEKVVAELKEKGFDEQILNKIKNSKPNQDIELILGIAQEMGVADEIYFDPTLARGIEIEGYSGGSVGGGGRFDKLIGMFAGKDIPAVGFAFGFDRLMQAMEELNLFPKDLPTTKVLVTIFPASPQGGSKGLMQKSLDISMSLRSAGVSTELYLDENTKMEKQLKYADQKQIPFAIIIGPDEASKNVITLRNMKTREQKTVKKEEIRTLVK